VIRPVQTLVALLPLLGGVALLTPRPAEAQALFGTAEVDQSRFVIVAAPIGDGSRAQLNIYEQRTDVRPCFAVQGSNPAVVDPLLSGFDFTGVCNRFIDGNGYSVRIGGSDLGTVYRLSVLKEKGDTLLMALPTKGRGRSGDAGGSQRRPEQRFPAAGGRAGLEADAASVRWPQPGSCLSVSRGLA